ncbi:MAG: sigma-70 family RNA polymerase sigma factor, partial [Oscillospiraceae bacterium]|nr:sigma-70 family RNA polymerase sigma factor [Oscillospiraceae bacterium]
MESMEEIYQSYAKTVYRYLLSLTRDEDLAEELMQESFVQAIDSIGKFEGRCKLSTWLCAIAKNQWLCWLRKHPNTASLEETEALTQSAETDVLA